MGAQKKILVVDDEVGIRWLLSDALSDEGFQVTMAKDGQESLDQLEGNDFDLVVTDINMPRVDGIEMLRWMRKKGRKEKVIILTGESVESKLSTSDLSQVVTQLQKPVSVKEFLRVVSGVIDDEKEVAKKRARGRKS